MQGRKRDTDVENRYVDVRSGGETNWESRIAYLHCKIASEKLPYNTGNLA